MPKVLVSVATYEYGVQRVTYDSTSNEEETRETIKCKHNDALQRLDEACRNSNQCNYKRCAATESTVGEQRWCMAGPILGD